MCLFMLPCMEELEERWRIMSCVLCIEASTHHAWMFLVIDKRYLPRFSFSLICTFFFTNQRSCSLIVELEYPELLCA
jgi:hypothetical protein